jgi:hypothetical protein
MGAQPTSGDGLTRYTLPILAQFDQKTKRPTRQRDATVARLVQLDQETPRKWPTCRAGFVPMMPNKFWATLRCAGRWND